jgi:hypothetical protein
LLDSFIVKLNGQYAKKSSTMSPSVIKIGLYIDPLIITMQNVSYEWKDMSLNMTKDSATKNFN